MTTRICDLQEELLMDILSRLRVKFIIRCKSVCKPWFKLLSAPCFINLQFSRSLLISSPRYLLVDGYPSLKSFDCGFLDDDEHYRFIHNKLMESNHNHDNEPPTDDNLAELVIVAINPPPPIVYGLEYLDVNPPLPIEGHYVVASCNGLVCLSDKKSFMSLLNPATREHVPLPACPSFDGKENSHEYLYILEGFGYDRVSDKYKVVQIIYENRREPDGKMYSTLLRVIVYTIGDSQWRSVEATPSNPYYITRATDCMTHVNGVLHFVNMHPGSKSIISFDLSNEVFGIVAFPDEVGVHPKDEFVCLHELEGSLLMNGIHGRRLHDMWKMENYGVKESWFKLFLVRENSWVFLPLFVRSKGEIVQIVLRAPDNMFIYVGNKSGFLILPWPEEKTLGFNHVLASYVESVISIASLMDSGHNSLAEQVAEISMNESYRRI